MYSNLTDLQRAEGRRRSGLLRQPVGPEPVRLRKRTGPGRHVPVEVLWPVAAHHAGRAVRAGRPAGRAGAPERAGVCAVFDPVPAPRRPETHPGHHGL